MNESLDLKHVSVIGGGRWARVVTETLIGLLPDSVDLRIHSINNSLNMALWAKEKGISDRLKVDNLLPEDISLGSAVIVVNAVKDHVTAAAHCLKLGASVLVEKPIAASFEAVKNLTDLAQNHHAVLVPGHVFMFADYIQSFIKFVRESGKIKQISLVWTDPKSETRYGEQKSYDSSLPIIADLLPHILSITSGLFQNVNPIFSNIELTKGGQNVNIEIKYNSIPCTMQMARNGTSRQRFIAVSTDSAYFEMDFAIEPAIFKCTSEKNVTKQEIINEDSPLRKMLKMFLAGCSSGSFDERFNMLAGLKISRIIDQAISRYRIDQASWIFENLSGAEIKENMMYALTEIFQVRETLSSGLLEQALIEFKDWAFNVNLKNKKLSKKEFCLKLERTYIKPIKVMTGILGSGFGLYGYFPAVLQSENKVFLLTKSKEKLQQRRELQKYAHKIVWVSDEDIFFSKLTTLIICVPPTVQEEYLKKIEEYPNIKYIILEKPIAHTPLLATDIVYRLQALRINFRVGYTFLYTDWYKKIESKGFFGKGKNLNIVWKFRAHYFINNIENWKRHNLQGGAVIRFYGIHLIALIVSFGFIKAKRSTTFEFDYDESYAWEAVFENAEGARLAIKLDTNSETDLFQIQSYDSNTVSDPQGTLITNLISPFYTGNSFGKEEDTRINTLSILFRSLVKKSENGEQYKMYEKINYLWGDIEKINHPVRSLTRDKI